MKQIDLKLKNTVEAVETKKDFSQFLSNFTTLRKAGAGFFLWDDKRMDYVALKDVILSKGIKDIPTESELEALL